MRVRILFVRTIMPAWPLWGTGLNEADGVSARITLNKRWAGLTETAHEGEDQTLSDVDNVLWNEENQSTKLARNADSKLG